MLSFGWVLKISCFLGLVFIWKQLHHSQLRPHFLGRFLLSLVGTRSNWILCVFSRSTSLAYCTAFEQCLLLQICFLDAQTSLNFRVNPLKTRFNFNFAVSIVISVNFKLFREVLHKLFSAFSHWRIKLFD